MPAAVLFDVGDLLRALDADDWIDPVTDSGDGAAAAVYRDAAELLSGLDDSPIGQLLGP